MVERQQPGATANGFRARLVATDGTSYELSGEQTLGRSQDADISIAHPKISRSHARFCVIGQQLTVQDLGSANGTCVNQRRIEGTAVLCDGDVVSFDVVDLGVVITGVIDENDATIISHRDDATVIGAWSGSAPDTIPEPPRQAPPVQAPPVQVPSEALVAPESRTPRAPLVDIGAVDLPGSFREQPSGEYTQVLSGAEAAAYNNAGLHLESASDLPHLIITMTSGAQQVLELEPGGGEQSDIWEIGRDKTCQIAIVEVGVSGRHAQLVHQHGRWRLVNLVSTNGIYVNGKKRLTAFLSDGDEIKLGMAVVVFKSGGAGANTSQTASRRAGESMGGKLVIPIALAAVAIAAAVGLWLFLK